LCSIVLPQANNSIYLADCTTGTVISGWQVGGSIYGVPQPFGGGIIIPADNDITLDQNLDLTTNAYTAIYLTGPRVLNFNHNELITGINIIDDMLFWTDGRTEPKRINIPRSILGTDSSANFHTRLINPDQSIGYSDNIMAREEHITVIRKAPKNFLNVKTEVDPITSFGTTSTDQTFLVNPQNPVQGNVIAGMTMPITLFIPTASSPPSQGDVVLFNPSSSTSLPNDEYQVKAILTTLVNSGYNSVLGAFSTWEITIESIDSLVLLTDLEYNWAVQIDPRVKKFKNKFTRFSYRYKYEDGEHSTFAPFTNVVFEPEAFKYDVKEAFNLGMENAITRITLSDYNINIPEDVVGIDILYKESDSPVVYIVDTIDSISGLTSPIHSYEIKPNQIKAALPSNQLLRAWDNVPKRSLAQEISGNRIIYGNYFQNYDLQEVPKIIAELEDRENCSTSYNYRSLKSIRNYSLGVSYLDGYGRQTPVFTNREADVDILIDRSDDFNQVSSKIIGSAPDWAKYYKVFVKETSSEYYNLAMDRVYDARDGNIWLSFPSSDRNKVDEKTFLILKKGVEGAQPVNEKNRYKVLAIENEAPTFIKTKQWVVAEAKEDPNTVGFTYFTNINGYPIENSKSIIINKTAWDGVNIPLSDIELMSVKFSREVGGQTQITELYDVSDFYEEAIIAPLEYRLTLTKAIKETWLNDPLNAAQPDPTIGMVVYKKIIEDSPEFDGRFFVKVARDIIIDKYIVSQASTSIIKQAVLTTQLPFYYLADQNNPSTPDDTTSSVVTASGTVGGVSNTVDDWAALYDPEGTGADSMWFIDAAHYVGYYDNDNTLQNHGMLGSDNFAKSGPAPNNPSELNGSGYNKGIYEENGQTYIDLSFGYIKAADGPGSSSTYGYAMHTDGTDTAGVQSVLDSFLNQYVPNHPSYGNSYFQEMKDGFSHGDGFGGQIAQGSDSNDLIKHWKIGSSLNANHNQTQNTEIVSKLQQNQQFQFAGDATTYTITGSPEITFHLNYSDLRDYYSKFGTFMTNMFPVYYPDYNGSNTSYTFGYNAGYAGAGAFQQLKLVFDEMKKASMALNKRVTWKIPISANPTAPGSTFNPINPTTGASATNIGNIQFVDIEWSSIDDQVVAEDPAIWETEPREDIDLDIYYEVGNTFPLEINNETNYMFAPIGSSVSADPGLFAIPTGTTVVSWNYNSVVELSNYVTGYPGMTVVFSRPDGSCVEAKLIGLVPPIVLDAQSNDTSLFLEINPDVSNQKVYHSWFNCYSFGNGVESDRIRDDYNQLRIDKGAKASSTLDEPYKEEHRKTGLIYSGLYNSTSGVNNLNQFIQAEKITKDLNPTYGSIQKLYAGWGQGGDLIALCEDRVLKILANKDALYNADGNSNITSTNNVLGTATPFAGNYGISKNPESFASESFRAYFTDKVRGAVIRLSMDGLTAISDHGMKDWFRDNLKLNNKLVGSYDDKKDEYNITLQQTTEQTPKTVSFREDVRGWVSFKSFVPENAISCSNEYYTFLNGKIWRHHEENVNRNTFYNIPADTSFTVILNDVPGSIKSFNTINYEGSQSRVIQNLLDNEYYNLTLDSSGSGFSKDGWYVDHIFTDMESGVVDEFIEKEGKWFNYIKGENILHHPNHNIKINPDGNSTFDQASFAIQGLGKTTGVVTSVLIYGCTDPTAFNYNAAANTDDGSCTPNVYGCTDPTAFNYNATVNISDNSCVWVGCTQSSCNAINSTIFPAERIQYSR
jgi:hypothetical protein